MCLSCEFYLDTCDVKSCVKAADPSDLYYMGKGENRRAIVLWRGFKEPCRHIKWDDPDWKELMDED